MEACWPVRVTEAARFSSQSLFQPGAVRSFAHHDQVRRQGGSQVANGFQECQVILLRDKRPTMRTILRSGPIPRRARRAPA